MKDYAKGFMEFAEDFDKLKAVREDIVCKEVAEWEEEWYKSILPENNKLSLKFDKWDDEFEGKVRSKLVPIIGYGGTKKSLLALNIAYHNIMNGFGKCLYSSMEMGATEVINRLIDLYYAPERYNPHKEIEYAHNQGSVDARNFYKENFAKVFGGRFFITENTALQAESYDKALTRFKEKGTNIDILIVDGLAGMGGSGTETELYSRHSKELKDLANKWKLLVLLICHVSKGGKKTDRDLSDKVRSSEKIIDNSDFYITASLFENGIDFDKARGNMRLVNKRGSGNILDVVYDFDNLKLTMKQSEYELSELESHTAGL